MSWLSSLTGIHISPKGVSVEPGKLITDAMALTGNPAAIAGVVGNGVHAVSPNSTLGNFGNDVGTIAPIAGATTGGVSSLAKILGLGGGAATDAASALDPANAKNLISVTGNGTDAGMSAVPGVASSAAASSPGIIQSVENWLSGTKGASASDALTGGLGKLGSFLTGNGGANALGVAQGVNQALNQKTATDYAKNALGTTEASYAARAPLRTQALSSLMNPQTPSLAGVNRTMTVGNPYAGAA